MSKIRKEYDRTVHPHIKIIAETCRSFGIPMFATFQVDPKEFKTFCINEERSNWAKLKMMCYMDETWSIDEFIEKLMGDALSNGHDSTYLEAMGIPRRPDGIKSAEEKIIQMKSILERGLVT